MSRLRNCAVINKKIMGNKVQYQLQKGNTTEWVEYENLAGHLNDVMLYEKERKNRRLPRKNRKEI